MTDSPLKSSRIPWVPVIIFLIVQSTVLLTWAPLGRGDLNPCLTAVGVVPLQVPFGDFRTISSGVQFYEQGGDPYTDGRYDFMGRAFNYPPIWLEMSFIGLSPEGVSYVYFFFASLFSISVMLLFWRETKRTWPLYFVFIFSPPVLLALERCNTDLLMFFLIVLGIWLARDSGSKLQDWICGVLLLAATVLKVFPVFAFYVFVKKNWRRTLLFLIPFGALCGIYFVSIKPTLDLIHENTPWSVYLSFGVNVIPNYLSEKFPESELFRGVIPFTLAWVLAFFGLLTGLKLGRKAIQSSDREGYDSKLFRVGGAVYIAVFLMGSNYDYRLMFLLLTLPFSFRMISQQRNQRYWFVVYLVALAAGLWINEASFHYWSGGALMEIGLLLNELASWVLFFMLVVSEFRLLPDFVRQVIYQSEKPV